MHVARWRAAALRRAVLGALSAAAMPGTALPVEPADLGTVTVVARVPRPLIEVAASVTVVDDAAIARDLAQDLRDVTRYIPGLALRFDPTRFGLDTLAIRGVGGNRVLLETDGVPAPAGFAVGNFSDSGRPFADLDLVKRMEILRGPASALYGSEAIGGVVSTRTLDPIDLLQSADSAVRLRAAYNSDDHSNVVSGTVAARSVAAVEGLLAFARRDGSELQNAYQVTDANPRAYARNSWLGKLIFAQFHDPVRLTVAGERGNTDTLVNSLLLQPGRFVNTVFMAGDDHAASDRVILDQSFTAFHGFEQIEWRVYWQQARAEQATHENRRAAPPRTPAVDLYRDFTYGESTAGLEATFARSVTVGRFRHRLVFGGEVTRHGIIEERDGLQTTTATGAVTNVILGEALPVRDFPLTTLLQAGIYLQDEVRAGGGRFTWMPALRIDHYRLRPRPDAVYSADNPRQVPAAITQTSASPRLGVTWRIRDEFSAFAQYAHGFRSPPFEDVNIGLDLPQFNVRAIPNPDLEPEKSDAFEVGIRSTNALLSGSASAYYTRYRDFIESKVNLGPDPATGVTIFQSRNLARAAIWGIDVEGKVRLGSSGGSSAPITVRAAVSFARGDDLERDRPLNSIDPAKLVVGVGYADAAGRWDTELVTTAIAAKRRIDDGAIPLVRTPAIVTFDLLLRWKITERLNLKAGLFNLSDRSYFEWVDVRNRPANDPTLDLYRRPGRNGSLSVSYGF
jgi:hemoglobin/transferrin/lactoferrin receptor protein